MGFTENFNYCMEQRNYSAYRFAKILGVNIQSPVNWKTGASIPHYGTRQKIAEHFGITLAELDGDELPVLPPEGAKKPPPQRARTKQRFSPMQAPPFLAISVTKNCLRKGAVKGQKKVVNLRIIYLYNTAETMYNKISHPGILPAGIFPFYTPGFPLPVANKEAAPF